VQVVYIDGRVSDESYARYVEALAHEIDTRDETRRKSVLYHAPQPAVVTNKRRTMVAEVLQARRDKLSIATSGYVLATPSAFVRGSVRIVFMLAPPPYPHAVVSTPLQGFEFLATKDPSLDPEKLDVLYREALIQLQDQMSR